MCTIVFVAELSIMEKKEKKKSSGEWINELQYLSTMEYYTVLTSLEINFKNMYIESKSKL